MSVDPQTPSFNLFNNQSDSTDLSAQARKKTLSRVSFGTRFKAFSKSHVIKTVLLATITAVAIASFTTLTAAISAAAIAACPPLALVPIALIAVPAKLTVKNAYGKNKFHLHPSLLYEVAYACLGKNKNMLKANLNARVSNSDLKQMYKAWGSVLTLRREKGENGLPTFGDSTSRTKAKLDATLVDKLSTAYDFIADHQITENSPNHELILGSELLAAHQNKDGSLIEGSIKTVISVQTKEEEDSMGAPFHPTADRSKYHNKDDSSKKNNPNTPEYGFFESPDFLPVEVDNLHAIANYIESRIQDGDVYIHCKAGHGRSTMGSLAYFLKYRINNTAIKSKDDLDLATKGLIIHTILSRPKINMNQDQIKGLLEFGHDHLKTTLGKEHSDDDLETRAASIYAETQAYKKAVMGTLSGIKA